MTTATRFPQSADAYNAAFKTRNDGLAPKEPGYLSWERLAEAVGVTRRHMARIARGDHRPEPEIRDRIAKELRVDPSTLPAAEDGPGDPFPRTRE